MEEKKENFYKRMCEYEIEEINSKVIDKKKKD